MSGTGRARVAPNPATDEELLARVGRGDAAAWGELYRRHRATVTGYVRNRVPANADVEDLVHEGFLLARDMAGDYHQDADPDYTVRAWLCGRAGQAIRQNAWSRHAYLLAADASRTTLREPVTETAAERDRQPLSAPVLHALAQLPPAQRRAIQLRYLDGLSEEQAAEVGQCSPRAIRSSSEVARRKLRGSLAELTPEARSPLQGLPRHEAARLALETVGADNVAGAQAWLRERGVQVSTTTMYEVRRDPNRPRSVTQAPPAYVTPEPIRALPPTERARVAGRDYRSHYDQLPSISQLADATGVSHPTAARALRELKAEHQAAVHRADEPAPNLATTDDGASYVRGEETAQNHRQAAAVNTQPNRDLDRRGRSEPRHDAARHDVEPPASTPTRRPADQRHRVRVHSQAPHWAGRGRTATQREGTSAGSADEHGLARRGGDANRAPRAEVSIAQARAAVAVLAAHRAVQAQSRQGDQAEQAAHDHTERMARWRADDAHSTHAEARSDAEGMSLQ